jgi:hypothetical protein
LLWLWGAKIDSERLLRKRVATGKFAIRKEIHPENRRLPLSGTNFQDIHAGFKADHKRAIALEFVFFRALEPEARPAIVGDPQGTIGPCPGGFYSLKNAGSANAGSAAAFQSVLVIAASSARTPSAEKPNRRKVSKFSR